MKKIRLIRPYRGIHSNDKRLAIGDYEFDEAIADHLIEKAYAEPIMDDEAEKKLIESIQTLIRDQIQAESVDYSAMTKDELLALVGDDIDQIEGTGARGNIVVADLIAWLQSNNVD